MTIIVKTLIARKQAESTQTTQYTATNARAIIDEFTATNTSSAPVTLSINLCNSGGTPGNDNLIVKTKAVAAGETYRFLEVVGKVLENGSFISTLAGSATSLTISASGREIT